jgi:hypothetical protein
MLIYHVRFDDGESFGSALTLEEAIKLRDENNFRFLNRSLHIYEITTWNGWNEKKVI